MSAAQIGFDWPPRVDLGAGSFFVSEANREAHAVVTTPATWPEGKLVLTGPPASGKTHLARLFAAAESAEILEAPDLGPGRALPESRAVVIENADRLPSLAQEWLFHLHNRLRPEGLLLLTAQTPPARWPLTLPDLASRLQAAPVARLRDPDDALLAAVLMKHFEDRMITPDERLVTYLVRRIDRSFAAAADIVARIDRAALDRGAAVTRNLAADLLDSDRAEG
ncbi:chromosomal replication initiator DnaA [Histidinibacterium lentulum]|uniref:Chromosomal replication initiator DnaA n=1 Tax=Histidinibacterium lentulum TaxID=2480588 RepID=A0A3N2QM68_9RHOB|nr:chromosomal replication initiator DnaA [Histidinibacterium lentulum]ROT96287.1 chromosomal replication initiator DnaA [Histidinibacterium lentulum]